MDRRQFLGTGTAALAAAALGGRAWAGGQEKAKRVGLVGCGWYGKNDLFRLLQVAPTSEVVSLCDPDKKTLAEAGEMVAVRQASKKTPRLHADYRELLKEKDLDLVVVGSPDHWHALHAIEAMKAGADVYCQKPISTDVVEGQAMVAAARKYKRVVQVGTQRRSTLHLSQAIDRILKDRIGKIGLVEICCYYEMRRKGNPPDAAAPEHLDWELWTGPAPMKPFNPMYHPLTWRNFWEYGNGIVGDMCIHMLDMVRWMMGLGWPKRISSHGGIYVDKESKANIPDTQSATFEYDGLNVVWTHRTWGSPPDPKYPWAGVFYGDKGTLKASVNGYDFIPVKGEPEHVDVIADGYTDEHEKTEPRFERHAAAANRAHMKDFLEAVAKRSKPVADIEEGHISTASCVLANLSMKLGRAIAWDAAKHEVAGDPEATKLLKRPYREPWVHPEPDKV